MSSISSAMYRAFQEDNEEAVFNHDLINWRAGDDPTGYLEDVFAALEVVPGITFLGVDIEKDESRVPAELWYNDVEVSRLNLAQVRFRLSLGEETEEITLSIFLPKLVDGLFYYLNDSLYFPMLQLVDRGTYVTKKTLTLKTLLMPLVLRRDAHAAIRDAGSPSAEPRAEMLFVLDLFKNKINAMKYFMASKGLEGTLRFFDPDGSVVVCTKKDVADFVKENGEGSWKAYEVKGPAALCVAAPADWVAENPAFRTSLLVSLADSLEGAKLKAVDEDDPVEWKRRLGRHFTQNSNGFEEKAEKILVSLERILDRRTRRNLEHVRPEDKEDVYCILRWMMREFRTLCQIDGMDVRGKRIRVTEYLIHPVLLKFSESTYRLLNSKSLTFKQLLGVFKPFIQEEPGGSGKGRQKPQANFLIKKLQSNELLRYAGVANSFDLLTALSWTMRGPQSMGDRGRGDIALRFRGHHPSYVGRLSLSAASASDPGVGGTLCPFARTAGQFFL